MVCLLGIIRSFHEEMYAGVRVGSTVSDRFEVRNGLRQGCTMAPTLLTSILMLWWPDGEIIPWVLELLCCLNMEEADKGPYCQV